MQPVNGSPGVPHLKSAEFDKIRRLAYDRFGLNLKPGKEELVAARLSKELHRGSFRSFEEYYAHVVADSTGESLGALIDALTTSFTGFLRESTHFDFLKETVIPQMKKRKRIRLWCAACSTGEEPYTLVLTLLDALGGIPCPDIRILATDISGRALQTAARGIYPEDRFAQVPENWKRRYLLRGRATAEGYYRIRPEIRKMVEFRRLNLIEDYFHWNRFPVIFCRNVMIYFDSVTRRTVVTRMLKWLEPGGYLFVGHSESLASGKFPLEYVRPAVYRKSPNAVPEKMQRQVTA